MISLHQPVALVGIRMAEWGDSVDHISGRTRGVVVEVMAKGEVCQTKKRPRGGPQRGCKKSKGGFALYRGKAVIQERDSIP